MNLQCPQCKIVNAPDAKFCKGCGVAFAVVPVKQNKAPFVLASLTVLGVVGLLSLCGIFATLTLNTNQAANTNQSNIVSNVAPSPTATPILTFAELKTKSEELLKFQKTEYESTDLKPFDDVMQSLRVIPKDSKDYSQAQTLLKKLINKVAPIGAEVFVLGEKPKNSSYDGRVDVVVSYLKANMNDYDDSEWLEWSPVTKITVKNEPFWAVRLKLRAKNAFGAKIVKDVVFFIRHNQVVTTTGL